jgi:tRNA pseudouridine38-40 synthase
MSTADVPTARVCLIVAYDGAPFHGFAENRDVATVGGTLRAALERVLGHTVTLTCAGRTDRGVHAQGQVVTFDAAGDGLDVDDLRRSVTKLCGGPIVVREASIVPDDFDARFSARSRTYRYTVRNAELPDPFLAATSWHVAAPLDLAALRLACDPVIGEHDFSSFCRPPKVADGRPGPSLVRRVLDARWDPLDDDLLRFEISATSFCHQMVRSIVGTMVEVGYGRKRAGEVAGILRAADRHAAGQMAPAHGLCLWAVAY